MSDTRRDILDELRISRKVVSAGEEVIPRFLVYTPSGKHTIMLPLSDEATERREHFRIAHLFMVWQAASGFILSTETKVPDAVTATLVSRAEVMGALQIITREPLKFGEPVWYGREELGDEVINLLPAKSLRLSTADLATIRDLETNRVPDLTWFKPRGNEE